MDPVEQNVLGVQQLVGSKLNKVPFGADSPEGAAPEKEDLLTLKLDDAELIKLARQWDADYRLYEGKLKPRQDRNKTFYLGQQKEGGPTLAVEPISANLLFEAEETFLPAALAKNPEPVVWTDNSEEGNALSKSTKTMLQYHADTLALRQKLKLSVRQWSIYLIGVIKHGWDDKIKDITSENRKPQNFIFNPNGFVNCYGDYEGYLGERITVTAEKLIEMFPEHRAYITILTEAKLGTEVTYTEWWTDEYCFYTFKDKVLDKHKNQYFNYDDSKTEPDEDEVNQTTKIPGKNHFGRPKKPYTFLTVFSLEEQPHDMTSLIEQNIPNQRRITRRTDQIDYNLNRQNNSDIFSEDNFNQETAKQAANAIAKGNPVIVPKGKPIGEAILRLQAQGIDAAFFNELEVSKQDLRQIFGTQGITSDPTSSQDTVRGKIIDQQHDSSRIGGGIGDALEIMADNIFNWWVQLYYVFYDEPHTAAIIGQTKATEYVELSAADFDRKLVVSVATGSLKPKDEITEMNQAMELYSAGALDPKSLLTILDFPDPQKTAENTVLWAIDKASYLQLNFPELTKQLQALQASMQMAGQQSPGQPQQNGIISPQQSENPSQPEANPSLSQVPIKNQGVPA